MFLIELNYFFQNWMKLNDTEGLLCDFPLQMIVIGPVQWTQRPQADAIALGGNKKMFNFRNVCLVIEGDRVRPTLAAV